MLYIPGLCDVPMRDSLVEQLPAAQHVLGVAGEGEAEKVDVVAHAPGADVLLVLGRQAVRTSRDRRTVIICGYADMLV